MGCLFWRINANKMDFKPVAEIKKKNKLICGTRLLRQSTFREEIPKYFLNWSDLFSVLHIQKEKD